MNTWNYRIVKRIYPEYNNQITYSIHEVYYDETDTIIGFKTDSVPMCAESVEKLRELYNEYVDAFKLPVLDYNNIANAIYTSDIDLGDF